MDTQSLQYLLGTTQKADNETDKALAARYAPIINFDAEEPFLPSAVGYTIFREDAPSPSFPRDIKLGKHQAAFAIEYAIWWDWDIQHLYELEHAWVYVNQAGNVVHAEASWHGGYHAMEVEGQPPLTEQRLTLYSESGKHAFAPSQTWLEKRAEVTGSACTRLAGKAGVLVTDLFKGLIRAKSPQADRLVHTYLERHSFVPTFNYTQIFAIPADILIPWLALFAWIPERVSWWVEELRRIIPPPERRFLRIAHRGASAHAPENTLAAIIKAAQLEADMVELDVQTSADKIPVIIHDADLSRVSDGIGSVSHYKLADLKKLNVGQGERIPTLAEAVECCLSHQLDLYLEIKSGSAIKPVVDLIQQRRLHGRTIVTSFRPDWLATIKHLDGNIQTSILFGSNHLDAVALAQAIGGRICPSGLGKLSPTTASTAHRGLDICGAGRKLGPNLLARGTFK